MDTIRKAVALSVPMVSILLYGCSGNPPPNPVPSPSPTPFPIIKIEGTKFIPELSNKIAIHCCDDPKTPEDEGLVEGWSMMTESAMNYYKSKGIKLIHIRLGLFKDIGFRYVSEAETVVKLALLRDMYVEVDLVDNWALATGNNFYSDTCSITWSDPPDRYLSYVETVIRKLAPYRNTLFNLGNEGFRCRPSPQWEYGLYNHARKIMQEIGEQYRPIGSQFFDAGESRPVFDYRTFGARFSVPKAFDVPFILMEDDGGSHNPDDWRRIAYWAQQDGSYVGFWRGAMSTKQWDDLLSNPTYPDSLKCPNDAPPIDRFALEVRVLASQIGDATPKVKSDSWCNARGMNSPCPYGDETPNGWNIRQDCERKFGPYKWYFNNVECDTPGTPCAINNLNPLQVKLPKSVHGTLKICAPTGWCSEKQI